MMSERIHMNDTLIFEFIDEEIKKYNSFYDNEQEDNFKLSYQVDSNYKQISESEKDAYVIDCQDKNVDITGKNARSILYGVYDYFADYRGYNFTTDIIEKPSLNITQGKSETARFKRRANILEVINDVDYVKYLIDQAGKSKLNEFFFTFQLWDEISEDIIVDLNKRGMNVCLGGHSLNFLLKDVIEDRDEKAFNLNFFEDGNLMDKAIEKVINTCNKHSAINRLSMWPADFGIKSESGYEFMSQYIKFIEKINDALELNKLDIEVEHIVYNAGLSWEMLERDERITGSDKSDVLYAYWGRDYSDTLTSSEKNQSRAYEILNDWKNLTNNSDTEISVLEYYSDFYMLSELFPPLANRIEADLNEYETLNVDGILNLIVPLLDSKNYDEIKKSYAWEWIHLYNNHIFSGLAWGKNLQDLKKQWFSQFNKHEEWYKLYDTLEASLSQISGFNPVLFNDRVVDLYEYVEKDYNEVHKILKDTVSVLDTHKDLFAKDDITSFNKDETIEYNTKYYLQTIKQLLEKTLSKIKIKQNDDATKKPGFES